MFAGIVFRVCFAILWTVFSYYPELVEAAHTEVECFPNSTITLTNPIPETLFFGSAIDSDAVCNLTFADNFTLIVLTGCSKSDDIVVQLTEIEHTNGVIGGSDKVLVHIRCQEITEGTEKNFTHALSVGLVVDETHAETQTFAQFAYVRNGSITNPPIAAAKLMENLLFTYDLHVNYALRFLQCIAYPGRDASKATSSYKLIENDCTVDSDLMMSFAPNKTEMVGNYTRYYTEMKMFRFWTSMYITIVCDVKICLNISSAPCTMGVCPNTRKRRSLEPEVEVGDSPDTKLMTSRTTIKLLENPDYIFWPNPSSSDSLLPELTVLVLAIAFGTQFAKI